MGLIQQKMGLWLAIKYGWPKNYGFCSPQNGGNVERNLSLWLTTKYRVSHKYWHGSNAQLLHYFLMFVTCPLVYINFRHIHFTKCTKKEILIFFPYFRAFLVAFNIGRKSSISIKKCHKSFLNVKLRLVVKTTNQTPDLIQSWS